MKCSSRRTTITHSEADKDVIRSGLGVLGNDIEVSILIEDSRVNKFEFGRVSAAAAIFFDEAGIREFRLRIFVESFQV